jgi:hypothetical protein
MPILCPRCQVPVEDRHIQAGTISTASVTDFSIVRTNVARVTGRETVELRYYCKNCGGQFSESEVVKETVGTLNLA